jgi:transposase
MLAIAVGPADVQDRDGMAALVRDARRLFPWLAHLFADQAYAGPKFARALGTPCPVTLEIVKRADGQKGFAVLPRRWVVERTFAWLTRCRRLARHYEALAATALAFIKLAMIRIMLRRLARPSTNS